MKTWNQDRTVYIDELFKTEDGAWILNQLMIPGINESSVRVFHAHCPKDKRSRHNRAPGGLDPFRDAAWFLDEEGTCWQCKAPVPDEIQGLFWMLEYGNNNLNKYDLGPHDE